MNFFQKQKTKFFTQSGLRKSVLTMMAGTAMSQVIIVICMPILTRLYSPEDFGIYALFISVTGLISPLAFLKYEEVLLITKWRRTFFDASYLCVLVSLCISFILLIVILLGGRTLFDVKIQNVVTYIPLVVFCLSGITLLNLWNNRHKQYKLLSGSRIFQSASVITLQVILSFYFRDYFGLLLGYVAGVVLTFLFLLYKTKYLKQFVGFKMMDYERVKAVSIKYKDFPIFKIPSLFFQLLNQQFPVLFLGKYYSNSNAAFYSLGQRSIQAPMGVITGSISLVFRQQISEDYSKGKDITVTFTKIFKKLALYNIPIFLIVLFFSPFLFSFIYGEKWRIAGEFVQILTPMLFLANIVSPLSFIFILREKQKMELLFQSGVFLCCVIAFFVGLYIFNSVKISLLLYSTVYSLKYIVELWLAYKYCKI